MHTAIQAILILATSHIGKHAELDHVYEHAYTPNTECMN